MENEFSTGGHTFKLSKINALKQFQIVRRMTPVLSELFPVLSKIGKKADGLTPDDFGEFSPVISAFSRLSDEDANKVLLSLLQSVEIKQDKGWARIASDQVIMFDSLELPTLLHCAGRAFMYNLQGFFTALPQVKHGQ